MSDRCSTPGGRGQDDYDYDDGDHDDGDHDDSDHVDGDHDDVSGHQW